MGLFSKILGTSAGALPTMNTKGYDEAITRMGKYTGPITGLSKQAELLKASTGDRRVEDLGTVRAGQEAAQTGAQSMSQMYGQDTGALERAGLQGQEQTGRAMAETGNIYSKMAQDLEASDYGMQADRQFQADQLAGQYEVGKSDASNRAAMANYQARAAQSAGKKKLFTGLASAAGTAFGGPVGGALAGVGAGLLS